MLYRLAHKLLEELHQAGAVLNAKQAIVAANEAFQAAFQEPSRSGGRDVLCRELRAALQRGRQSTAKSGGAQTITFQRGPMTYQLDVYFLDSLSGQEGLRLVTATPVTLPTPAAAQRPAPEAFTEALAPAFSALVGQAPSFVQALHLAQRAAQTDLPVLILGESGTGKEVLARTIHEAGRRSKKAFVDVNCAAIPDSLVESELFGYERGAFTGANLKGKAGFFEAAHQGTIFMDEIGDAAPQTQAKLLRVLESGQFKRIGSNRNMAVDVRLIAATNQELGQRIAEGRFRADLLYRLNTITIRLAPLRERMDDLCLLIEHFLKTAVGERKNPPRVSREALELLRAYGWPGNVRELKGVIDYAVAMTPGKVLTPRSFPAFLRAGVAGAVPEPASGPETASMPPGAAMDSELLLPVLERVEKEHIRKVLERAPNRSEAIRRLGISRRTFYAKIRQYRLG